MSLAVSSYLRGAGVVRFLQLRIRGISDDIATAETLKQRVKELEDSVSTLREEKLSMEKAHTGVVRAKDAEVERILVKDAETEKEIAGLHLTVGQLESDLKPSEEMVSGLQFDVERL